ncbi:hypothetical protein LCM20_17295 [Halobacillus litoralis]|uniref:hypothetical protein n=1 Tax=Halobacillus litoralis TaxID=45668 RepID=UPI001CD5924C|nr:hypothetical protein [Halobacillus litoralis]MCA0972366.1 hypothetical protein [Halobacillus litoralis]
MDKKKIGLILVTAALWFSLFFNYQSFHENREKVIDEGKQVQRVVEATLMGLNMMSAGVWEDVITSDGESNRFEVLSGEFKLREGAWRSLSFSHHYGYEIVDLLSRLNKDIYELKDKIDSGQNIEELKTEIDLKVNALSEIMSYAEENLPEDKPAAWAEAFDERDSSDVRDVIREQYWGLMPFEG